MRCPSVHELPPPPPGKSGWPWTVGSPPVEPGAVLFPRITVVTPSYNQGHFIEETIRSVLLQGYPDLDYIVIDGGSSDNTVDIVRKYERYLTYWTSERDRGQSDALNKGFARSTGAIRAFLNSDDYYEPGALHHAAAAMATGEAWVVGQVRYLNEEHRTWPLPAYAERHAADWFLHCPVPQPGAFWSAGLHNRASAFRDDLRFFFDYDFWMRLRFDFGARARILPQTLAVYRLHSQSKTISQNDAFVAEARAIRAQFSTKLTRSERLYLCMARYRKRASACGSRAKAQFATGNAFAGAFLMLGGILMWPPLALDGRVTQAIRRLLNGEPAVRADEPPMVWNYYDD